MRLAFAGDTMLGRMVAERLAIEPPVSPRLAEAPPLKLEYCFTHQEDLPIPSELAAGRPFSPIQGSYRCLRRELGQSLAQLHTHGGRPTVGASTSSRKD